MSDNGNGGRRMALNESEEERRERIELRRRYAMAALSGLAYHAASAKANEIDTARVAWMLAEAMLETENDEYRVRRPPPPETRIGRAYNDRR